MWFLKRASLLILLSLAVAPQTTALAMGSGELREQLTQCGYAVARGGDTSRYVVIEDPGAAQIPGADYRIVMAIVFSSACHIAPVW